MARVIRPRGDVQLTPIDQLRLVRIRATISIMSEHSGQHALCPSTIRPTNAELFIRDRTTKRTAFVNFFMGSARSAGAVLTVSPFLSLQQRASHART